VISKKKASVEFLMEFLLSKNVPIDRKKEVSPDIKYFIIIPFFNL